MMGGSMMLVWMIAGVLFIVLVVVVIVKLVGK